ncbi:MAG TPA: SDR family NAD(P)-dependent oxidoreductase [Methylomirabilota bacterium]|nr:SDR family NAD(P)-dependent oxidoreductase [Methylomirabilota bacterium]
MLVTGGAGFIGSHLVEALVEAGSRVRVLDDFSSGRREHLADVAGVADVVEGDVCDEATLDRVFAGVDVVFHLATRGVRLSLSQPVEVHRVNSEGTLRALWAARRAGVGRFVYVSSSEVYGTAVTVPMSEGHPLAPTTVYGATKLAGEHYARAMTESFGLPTVIVRPFNTYGPRAHFEGAYGEVIPRFTVRLLNGLPPVMFGDGMQTRDFTYVTDTVRGILFAATRGAGTGEIVNVARGEEVSILRIARLLGEAVGHALDPTHAEARPADVRRHWADVSLARERLGFTASVGIEEGLRRYLEWFRATYRDPAACLAGHVERNW